MKTQNFRMRPLLFSLAIGLVMSLASTASATSSFLYIQTLLTEPLANSGLSSLLNFEQEIECEYCQTTSFVEVSDSLGNGYVSRRGPALTYRHTFEPNAPVQNLDLAALHVFVRDDQWFDWKEEVVVSINGDVFDTEQVTLISVLGGFVETSLFAEEGFLDVRVEATSGDFQVMASLFAVSYDSNAAAAVPEPGAMALFFAGVSVVAASRKSWRREGAV
ncbi:MAG: PEP-CTERM sorting domain-containing protein [Myxococcota bacterium]|nr:PEP-CTERM sorting domain-containing protein [Myxococcota bacterium]